MGKKGRRRRNKSERCVRAQPSSMNSHLPQRVVILIGQQQRSLMIVRGPTTTFLHACAWKLRYVLYPSPNDEPKHCLVDSLLHDTYVILNSNYRHNVVVVRLYYWNVIPPHISYQYSYFVLVFIASKPYVDRPHNADCYTYASPVVLTDTLNSGTHWY